MGRIKLVPACGTREKAKSGKNAEYRSEPSSSRRSSSPENKSRSVIDVATLSFVIERARLCRIQEDYGIGTLAFKILKGVRQILAAVIAL